jgi:hypothetical protein
MVEAETAFRAALALDPSLVTARYNLGVTLLKMSRDAEGRAALTAYLTEPDGKAPDVATARRLVENLAGPARTMRRTIRPPRSMGAR